MYYLKPFLLIVVLLTNQIVLAQKYTSPVDFNILLSGTFGELRNNHFHAGIDIKTEGVEGQNIRAIADGYVSRIKVSSFGYGKVIYLTHPETGHTSVYAHLKEFSAKIDDLVKKEHYKKERFEINIYPNKDVLLIKQGEIIALSGNSGSSNGAHLHFEIRDTESEKPINPLQFGFKINDNIPPSLRKLKIYAFDTTLINGYNKSKIYNINKNNSIYSLRDRPTINGSFALGIFTYDKSNNSYNKNGIYSIKLSIDNSIHYEFKADELDFNTTRYINAHMDYCEKQESREKYHRCYKLENNKLDNYPTIINDGIISFKDDSIHLITVEVSDFYGNTSELSFNIQSTNKPFLMRCPLAKDTTTTSFKVRKTNMFNATDFRLYMQPDCLYEPLNFRYNTTDSVEGVYGLVHSVHNNTVPVHKKYTLSIKANVPDSLRSKTYIATTNMKGTFWHLGGRWQNGFLKTKVREFGDFCIVADTTKPEIRGLNIFQGKTFNTQTTIKLTIKDKDSGIESYRGEIDGKWILMDYDHKKNLLQFDIGRNISKGKHTFTLKVIDNAENTSDYSAEFIY